ncbi:HD-GYP domain-containing protein [Salinivibrio proteolyticus]|uniref:HD domain-containing protein n=2 Tax=Gammaproteobacteria TaxID=1236 RepID=A0ABY7LD26_9GAMM|nr:HD domain-containing phosphohydrolase [Salinivibrio proteolyticus]WBA13750.1 HD domain-containing protein [Salinivibrio proteolyticus]
MKWLRQWLAAAPSDKQAQRLFQSLLTLAWSVESKDPYTGGHLWRVSRFAYTLAKEEGWSEEDRAAVTLGGFLHDLGKVSVPDEILRKTARLTDDEFAVIQNHPNEGLYILEGHPLATIVSNAVGLHHERIDGKGYPNQLHDHLIPADAKVIAICDAFDAMTSQRPYRNAMPKEKAIAIIEENLGTQFDEKLGARFVALAKAGKLDSIIAHTDEGIPLYHCPTCGPTITRYRSDKSGHLLHCPVCLQQAKLVKNDGAYTLAPTGIQLSPAKQRRKPDTALIRRVIQETIDTIPTQALLARANERHLDLDT